MAGEVGSMNSGLEIKAETKLCRACHTVLKVS